MRSLVALALLFACTPEGPEQRSPTPSKPSEPTALPLPGGPSPTPTSREPDPITPTGELLELDPFEFLAGEAIGELRLDMSATEVVDLLGNPPEKGAIEEEGATGEFVQSWGYPDIGVQLDMRAPTRRGAQTLGSVTVTAPSKLETKRKIAIGSSWADVVKAYNDVQTHERFEPDDQSSFVAGSVYGGLIFSFEGDAVSAIFMGGGAE